LPYLPAGTVSGFAIASFPVPSAIASEKPGTMASLDRLLAGSINTRRLLNRSARVPGTSSPRLLRYSIQSMSAEIKTSAGAPASICLARVLLPAYEIVTFSPVSRSNPRACSSSASLRLAAAKTVSASASWATVIMIADTAINDAKTRGIKTFPKPRMKSSAIYCWI